MWACFTPAGSESGPKITNEWKDEGLNSQAVRLNAVFDLLPPKLPLTLPGFCWAGKG